jgi:RNA polymerase sigma-70 factor (sigma-E family)
MSYPVSDVHLTWTLQDPGRARPGTGSAGQGSAPAGPARETAQADLAITAMYDTEYRSLVRMSAVLLGDVGSAEEIVQDSFIAVHAAWRGLRDIDKSTHYLRRTVMNRSRSLLRHRAVVEKHMATSEPDMPSAEQAAITRLERTAVIAALRTLPARQRQALVLKFYLGLSEEEVAAAMQISQGAVKSHTARAKAALRSRLEPER